MENIFLKDVMVAFIQSIDLVNAILKRHHSRVSIIAYQLGIAYELPQHNLMNLVLAASIHDIGALTIQEQNELVHLDIENPHPHAIRGSMMLDSFPPFEEIAYIIRYHHWPWENHLTSLSPDESVPLECYLLHLADRIDILIEHDTWILSQKDVIREAIASHAGILFSPASVDCFMKLSTADEFWLNIDNLELEVILNTLLTDYEKIEMSGKLLEQLAFTLSRIIDYRSAFTATHSYGVGLVAYELGRLCQLPQDICDKLKVAGFLHDIGKIGIPPEILEKPATLEQDEYQIMKAHAYYTKIILQHIKGLEEICNWASMHHEKHDGSGYPSQLTESKFTIESDIIAYADVFTALSEDRPYRGPFDLESIVDTLDHDYREQLGDTVFSVIKRHARHLNGIRQLAQTEAFKTYQSALHNHFSIR